MVDKAWHCNEKDFILLIQNNGDTFLIWTNNNNNNNNNNSVRTLYVIGSIILIVCRAKYFNLRPSKNLYYMDYKIVIFRQLDKFFSVEGRGLWTINCARGVSRIIIIMSLTHCTNISSRHQVAQVNHVFWALFKEDTSFGDTGKQYLFLQCMFCHQLDHAVNTCMGVTTTHLLHSWISLTN